MYPTIIDKKYLLELKKTSLNTNRIKDDPQKKKYIEDMICISQAMVEKWGNTYEKILEREEKKRNEKKKIEELERIKFYKKLMEEKQLEREKLITDTKDTFFKQKDEPRQLESALLCAEMLKEQQAQREFNRNLKEKEKEKDLEYSKFINKVSEDWLNEQLRKRQLRIHKDLGEAQLVKEQAEKDRHERIENKKNKLIMEKEDNENAKKEIEKLNENAMKMKKEECESFKKYIKSALDDVEDQKRKDKELDRKENEIIEIQRNTQFKINEMRKIKEKQIATDKIKARDVVRKTIISNQKKIKAEEEKYLKAQEEFKKRDIEMTKKEIADAKVKKDERINFHKEWLEEEKNRKKIKETIKARDIANRFKNIEYTKKLNEKLKQERMKKISENKLFILQQQKELAEKKSQEKKDRFEFYITNMSSDMNAADEKFLSYANQLLTDCEAKGRPTYPLHKVINDYKKRYMQPDKRVPKHLLTHFSSIINMEN